MDLGRGLSGAGLDTPTATRHYLLFLNQKNARFRARKMKEKPPSRGEAIPLMAANPNLIGRPAIVPAGQVIVGLDAKAIARLGETP